MGSTANFDLYYPDGSDNIAPLTPVLAAMAQSVDDVLDVQQTIFAVANTTERAAYIAAHPASADKPRFVWREDAEAGHKLEMTVDGSTWINFEDSSATPPASTITSIGTDLNTITTMGWYRAAASTATFANNYPVEGSLGLLAVYPTALGEVMQDFALMDGRRWVRIYNGTVWGAWANKNPTHTLDSAGGMMRIGNQVIRWGATSVSTSSSVEGSAAVSLAAVTPPFTGSPYITCTVSGGGFSASVSGVSVSGFTITIRHLDGTSTSLSRTVYWHAIGPV